MVRKGIVLLILSAMLMLFASACGAKPVTSNDDSLNRVSVAEQYSLSTALYDDFLDVNPDRTAFTEGEGNASIYLLNLFKTIGLTNTNRTAFQVEDEQNTYTSYNVSGVYASSQFTSDNVIIGFNYDNNFAKHTYSKGTRAEGAASAGGAGAVLCVAQYLVENAVELPFNVTFVAFGAGNADSLGLYERISFGAYVYVNGDGLGAQPMSVHEIANTKLMINVDNITVGDHLYLYTDEKRTASQGLFESSYNSFLVSDEDMLYAVPSNRPFTNMTTPYVSGLSILHRGTMGAHAPFMSKMNTAHFFGANLDFSLNNLDAESKNFANVTLTSNDTREVLLQINANFRTRITSTSAIIIKTLTSPDFLEAHQTTQTSSFLDNQLYLLLIKMGIIVICGVLAFIWSKHLNRKNIPPIIMEIVNRRTQSVFGEDYDGKDGSAKNSSGKSTNSSDNDDDVFKGY